MTIIPLSSSRVRQRLRASVLILGLFALAACDPRPCCGPDGPAPRPGLASERVAADGDQEVIPEPYRDATDGAAARTPQTGPIAAFGNTVSCSYGPLQREGQSPVLALYLDVSPHGSAPPVSGTYRIWGHLFPMARPYSSEYERDSGRFAVEPQGYVDSSHIIAEVPVGRFNFRYRAAEVSFTGQDNPITCLPRHQAGRA